MNRLEFNNHVLQLSRKLYLVAFRFLRRQDEAEDAVQEVFMKLWSRNEELPEFGNIEAFATTAVKNYCIDILRRSKKLVVEDHNNHHGVYDKEPSPHESLENSEISSILDGIIQRLPEQLRQIVTLKEIDGLSYQEIVEITGQNVNSLRVNLSRARKMIRDEYKKHKYEYSGNFRTVR